MNGSSADYCDATETIERSAVIRLNLHFRKATLEAVRGRTWKDAKLEICIVPVGNEGSLN